MLLKTLLKNTSLRVLVENFFLGETLDLWQFGGSVLSEQTNTPCLASELVTLFPKLVVTDRSNCDRQFRNWFLVNSCWPKEPFLLEHMEAFPRLKKSRSLWNSRNSSSRKLSQSFALWLKSDVKAISHHHKDRYKVTRKAASKNNTLTIETQHNFYKQKSILQHLKTTKLTPPPQQKKNMASTRFSRPPATK